ncbi:MAG: NADP oxidoreductase, partial [Anaerolineae bacterium]
RRGPAQAAFTNPELKEFGELSHADIVVPPAEAQIDPLSEADLIAHPDNTAKKNIELLQKFSQLPAGNKPRRIHMRFLVSPAELLGTDHVEAIKLVKNELQAGSDGTLRAKATDQFETMPVGLVFRSIGYKGVSLPDVPFDPKAAVIPNVAGRVIDPANNNSVVTGEYVVGWIKRGPSGIIGTNKPDSVATVDSLVADLGSLNQALLPDIEPLLRQKQPQVVSFEDWRVLDRIETERGAAQGRPRVQFSDVGEMLAAIQQTHKGN